MHAKPRKAAKTAWRASWKGELRLGLVRFTVEAVNARSRSGGDIHFHQLHEQCHSRIEYQKVCPIHGQVDQDEIVLGYEYGRGKYVAIDPDELDALRTREERALTIQEFIRPDELDPIYYDGRMYYLVPFEATDREPYHLFRRALGELVRFGIGQVVSSGKEQLAAVQPRDQVLLMAMLNYAPELRSPGALGVGDNGTRLSSRNLRLAKELVHSMDAHPFRFNKYEDRYRDRVAELIDAKRKGKEIVAPPEEEEPVINLMDALKKSLAGANGHSKRHARRSRAHSAG